ncbi:MAG: HAMP domain-containing sensor histidine kinase [Chitinophagaceae bacterium]
MKLQAQYNRITIISSLFILLLAAAGYYFLLRYVLIRQLDESLKVEEVEIYDYIRKHGSLPAPTVFKDQRISFSLLPAAGSRSFNNLETVNPDDNKEESSRQLLFPVKVNGQYYMVSVIKSAETTEDLVWIILFSTIALIVLLTAILFFTNRFLLKKLWQPFRNTLSSIKEFNLSAPGKMNIQPTKITEFRELNESIKVMAEKVVKDYLSLRDFTDHASHEMQTPLAVINSKLDVLIQEPELSEKSMHQVEGIYKAVEKLSRLCQSLLLLARIENKEYRETQRLSVNELVEEKVSEMEEWMNAMNLKVTLQLNPLEATMNRELADILIGNLLRNAIRHNETGGQMTIRTENHMLFVCNSGKKELDQNRIFDRFYKSDYSEGSGLGLPIVQHICEQYHFTVEYHFNERQHCFSVSFI